MMRLSRLRWGYFLIVLALWSAPWTAPWSAPCRTFAQEKTQKAFRAYNAAVGLHNSEAWDLAANAWIEFLNDYPKDPRINKAWNYLGVCYFKQGKFPDAAKTFETVEKSFPNFEQLGDTLLYLGLTQYNMAQGGKPAMYETAAATFKKLAAKYPDGKHITDALFYEGECFYNSGKKKEAAEKYAIVVEKYPTHASYSRALLALAMTQTDLGQAKAALPNYDKFLAKFPESSLVSEARMWRGEALFALKQFDEAAKGYAAAAVAKGFAKADYATLREADSLAALKQFAAAAAAYASLPAKFPDSQYVALCHLEAGKKFYAAKDYTNARKHLGKVVAAGGAAAPEAAHWVARSLLKEKQPAEALAVVEKILPNAGESKFMPALLMDQAEALYETPDRRGESVALYAAVGSKYPDSPEAPQALYMAAFAAMNLGDYETALKHAEAFTAAHSDHGLSLGVKHVLAESKLLLKKYPEAEVLYTELLDKSPDDREAEIWKVHRGTAMYLQNKHEETIAALQPVIAEVKSPELLAEAWYRIGRSQAALGRFDEAIKSLDASLKASPNWKLADDTHLVLAYAYQQTNNLDKAKENAKQVLSDFPNSKLLDMAHYRLAECSRLGGDLKTAADEYGLILEKWPNSTLMQQTLYGLGWARIGLDDYENAEKNFTALIVKYPDDKLVPRARYGRGMARRQLKKYGPAVEDIEAMLDTITSPAEKARALHILGLSQKGLKDYGKAVATLQTLLKEHPKYDDADNVYFELGWALKSLKKEDEAAKTFAEMVEKFPDSTLVPDAQYLVGDHQYDKKEYKAAAKTYYAAMTKAGKTELGEEAAYKLGLCYYLLDDIKNAQQTFHYLTVTWPGGALFSDGIFMEAECLFKQDKFKEALAAYEKVKDPSNKEINILTLLHASQAAAQLDDWEKTLKLAEKLTTEFPDAPQAPQALYEQGWAQQNLDKKDEAVKLYEQVIEKTNLEPAARAQFMIGEIQFEQKKHKEAVTSFFKVSYGYGYPKWQANATYEAARCFEVLKKKPQAIKQYQMLVEKFPGSDKVPLAKERIKALQ